MMKNKDYNKFDILKLEENLREFIKVKDKSLDEGQIKNAVIKKLETNIKTYPKEYEEYLREKENQRKKDIAIVNTELEEKRIKREFKSKEKTNSSSQKEESIKKKRDKSDDNKSIFSGLQTNTGQQHITKLKQNRSRFNKTTLILSSALLVLICTIVYFLWPNIFSKSTYYYLNEGNPKSLTNIKLSDCNQINNAIGRMEFGERLIYKSDDPKCIENLLVTKSDDPFLELSISKKLLFDQCEWGIIQALYSSNFNGRRKMDSEFNKALVETCIQNQMLPQISSKLKCQFEEIPGEWKIDFNSEESEYKGISYGTFSNLTFHKSKKHSEKPIADSYAVILINNNSRQRMLIVLKIYDRTNELVQLQHIEQLPESLENTYIKTVSSKRLDLEDGEYDGLEALEFYLETQNQAEIYYGYFVNNAFKLIKKEVINIEGEYDVLISGEKKDRLRITHVDNEDYTVVSSDGWQENANWNPRENMLLGEWEYRNRSVKGSHKAVLLKNGDLKVDQFIAGKKTNKDPIIWKKILD